MTNLRQSSIDGFNQFLRDQRVQGGDCRLSLTMFDTSFDVRHVAKSVWEIPELTLFDYNPSGMTALLDAVGTTIKGAEQWVANQKTYAMGGSRKGYGPDYKVVVAILTDGEENSSREWHLNQPMLPGDDHDVGGLIQWKQNEGWEFMFLGAGGSGWLERNFGSIVGADRIYAYQHDSHAHRHTYGALSRAISTTQSTGSFTFDPQGTSPHNHSINQNTYDDGHSVSSDSTTSS